MKKEIRKAVRKLVFAVAVLLVVMIARFWVLPGLTPSHDPEKREQVQELYKSYTNLNEEGREMLRAEIKAERDPEAAKTLLDLLDAFDKYELTEAGEDGS